MIFGDSHDPDSEISRILSTNAVQVLKGEMGTDPHVFYIGADGTAMSSFEEENIYSKETDV